MNRLEVIAHMMVRPGQLDGFKQQAAGALRLTQEQDTQTLRYDWFLSRDDARSEAHEVHERSEGMIEHPGLSSDPATTTSGA